MQKKVPQLGKSASRLIAHVITSSSIIIMGMWAILVQSSPFSLWHLFSSKWHPKRRREEREAGNPSFGKHWRLSQIAMSRCWREVRCWNSLSDFRFRKKLMVKWVRVGGSNAFSGKDSNSSLLKETSNFLREWRACNPHSMRREKSL